MMTIPYIPKSVLSIQSHVVHGYVGNKASSFPLQTMGWDVDVLNTVNFSNHTGYGDVSGTTSSGAEITEIYQGLKDIGMKYSAILTGYIHGAETVEAVREICIDIKEQDPKSLWLLDPVMGDEGQLYVNEDVIDVYKRILASKLVDIITPNQFEMELLLGFKITDRKSLLSAFQLIHSKFNVKHIIVSSLSSNVIQSDEDKGKEEIFYCAVSSTELASDVYLFEIQKLNSYFTGVGDLFSALLLDRVATPHLCNKEGQKANNILEAVNEALSVMSKVLSVTQAKSFENLGTYVKGKIGDSRTMRECELRIIECRDLYEGKDHVYSPTKMGT